MSARLRLGALLLLVLVLETTVVPDLRLAGVCPDLMLLCAICAGLVGGPELGGLVGFAGGLLADLFLQTTPLGLSALSYSLVGYAVGSVRRTVLQEGWLLAPATALVASAAGVVVFVLTGAMVGQSQLGSTGPMAIVEVAMIAGVMNAIIAAPVCRVVAWCAAGSGQSAQPSGDLTASRAGRRGGGAAAGRVGPQPARWRGGSQ